MSLQILIVDDHALYRDGLKLILNELEDEVTIYEANDCSTALDTIHRNSSLDLVLLDLTLSDAQQFACMENVFAIAPMLPIIILSANEEKAIVEAAIRKGAQGYIPKSYNNSVILNAIRLVLSGGTFIPPITFATQLPVSNSEQLHITERQLQVLLLIDQGLSNKQIGRVLNLTEGTVKAHITAIFRILNVENRINACKIARQMNLLEIS